MRYIEKVSDIVLNLHFSVFMKNFYGSSDICPMGFIYSIQICEISHQTFGPSHRKCPTCPMIFVNTVFIWWSVFIFVFAWKINQILVFAVEVEILMIFCICILLGISATNSVAMITSFKVKQHETFLRKTNGMLNSLRPRQNGCHFTDDIFKCIFLNEDEWIALKISLKFVAKIRINNIPVLFR